MAAKQAEHEHQRQTTETTVGGEVIAAKIKDVSDSNGSNKNVYEGEKNSLGASGVDGDVGLDSNGNTGMITTNKRINNNEGDGIDIYVTNDKFPTNFNNALDFFVINTLDTTRAITTNNRYKKSSSGSSELLTTSALLSNPEKMLTVKSSLFSIEHIIKKE